MEHEYESGAIIPMEEAHAAIERLTKQALGQKVKIDDKEYCTVELHDPRKPEPEPAPLVFHTLKSFAEYAKGTHDRGYLTPRTFFVHVESPTAVRLCTGVFGERNQRAVVARAEAIVPSLGFGQWQDPETFNIQLQAHFEDSAGRQQVLSLIGSLKTEAVQTVGDDGVTQQVTAARGLVLVEKAKVPNPVELRPYRSFSEIAQVESCFVLRLRGGGDGRPPTCALFESDGGVWRLTAIERIKAELHTLLGDSAIVVYA